MDHLLLISILNILISFSSSGSFNININSSAILMSCQLTRTRWYLWLNRLNNVYPRKNLDWNFQTDITFLMKSAHTFQRVGQCRVNRCVAWYPRIILSLRCLKPVLMQYSNIGDDLINNVPLNGQQVTDRQADRGAEGRRHSWRRKAITGI